jgi:hypothetical protein
MILRFFRREEENTPVNYVMNITKILLYLKIVTKYKVTNI